MEGYQGHFRMINKKKFQAKDGTIATDNKSNVRILKNHYHKVFNRQVEVDESILEQLKQRPITQELGEPPDKQQVHAAIQKMKTNKAPGISGVTTDMLKNLPNDAIDLLTTII